EQAERTSSAHGGDECIRRIRCAAEERATDAPSLHCLLEPRAGGELRRRAKKATSRTLVAACSGPWPERTKARFSGAPATVMRPDPAGRDDLATETLLQGARARAARSGARCRCLQSVLAVQHRRVRDADHCA